MKALMTILATITLVTCQNHNSGRDYTDYMPTTGIYIIDDKLQKAFEEQAFTVVMKNTKRVTDSVVLEISKRLSLLTETRRQARIGQEFRQVSQRWPKANNVRTEDSGAGHYCGTGDIEQLMINGSNKPIDTVVGYYRITKDRVPYVMTACDENISLDFFDLCPFAGDDEIVAFIGSFERMCPADRRFSEIFTVKEFSFFGRPMEKERRVAQIDDF